MPTRKQIVDEARSWIGTPFRHQGRLKGVGVDCIGLGFSVARALGLGIEDGVPMDRLNYSAQPMGDYVHEMTAKLLKQKPLEEMKEGDLVTVRMMVAACHLGIVSKLYAGTKDECLGIIHAFSSVKQVVETRIDDQLRARIVGCFEFPGVTD
jgi:NlpC/P60 family putative phage cell wall peptidase